MSYPLSTDVLSGQPTAASQYNNLRADALRFGCGENDALALGTFLRRTMSGVRIDYLAANRLRVPFSSSNPPSLVVNGYLLQANANVDLPAGMFSGAAAQWFIFAKRTAGSTVFSLEVNTNSAETADQRLIGEVYWDGSNLVERSLLTYTLISNPATSVLRTTAQSIANISTTAVSFDSEIFDEGNQWLSAAPTRLTCGKAGTYVITGSASFAGSAAGGYRELGLRINGAVGLEMSDGMKVDSSNGTSLTVASIRKLARDDYVELTAWQSSGGALNINANTAFLSFVRVGSL
jgi:hypothetical protein